MALFHEENARENKSLDSMVAMRNCDFERVDHPSYSPGFTSSLYHQILNMKTHLVANQCHSVHIVTATDEHLTRRLKPSSPM